MPELNAGEKLTVEAAQAGELTLHTPAPAERFDRAYWEREVAGAVETPDPPHSDRRVTLVHYGLSQALRAVTGADAGANFHTWPVWGSRKAGVTIRQEDLGEATRNATVVAGIVGSAVGPVASWISITSWPAGRHSGVVPLPALGGMCCGARPDEYPRADELHRPAVPRDAPEAVGLLGAAHV